MKIRKSKPYWKMFRQTANPVLDIHTAVMELMQRHPDAKGYRLILGRKTADFILRCTLFHIFCMPYGSTDDETLKQAVTACGISGLEILPHGRRFEIEPIFRDWQFPAG